MKFCKNCNKELADYELACPYCGAISGGSSVSSGSNSVTGSIYTPAKSGGGGSATASMVCGILGIIFVIPCSIIAMVLGISAKKQGCRSGRATAGIVLAIVSLVFWILYFAFVVLMQYIFYSGYYI